MKPKIALIIERADVLLGGAERSVLELAEAVGGLGYEVHILAAKGRTDAGNIHILCGNSRGKRTGLAAFGTAIKRHLAENHYDVIHSTLPLAFADIYQPRGGTYVEAVIRNAASYESHRMRIFKRAASIANFRRTSLLRAEKKLAAGGEGPLIVAISNYVARQFREHYHIDAERLTIVLNGVRVDAPVDAGQADRMRSRILRQLGLKEADNPVLFLFAAHNFRLKGLGCLIKAMHAQSAGHPKARVYLVVAGRGNPSRYRQLVQEINVQNRILFIGTTGHIQNLLAVTDVAVLPTFYDPCSRFILEALAAGRPVITTKFNGAVDLFTAERHGKVVDDPCDVASLSDAIAYLADRENIAKCRQAILDDNLKAKVSVGRAARELKPIYDAIIERRRR